MNAAQAVRLDLAGVDIILPDPKRSWFETGALVCEINAQPALGVFNHEAVAVDMSSKTLFLTEDAGDGRLYRFVSEGELRPAVNGQMGLNMEQGKLQVIEIVGFEAGALRRTLLAWRSSRFSRSGAFIL